MYKFYIGIFILYITGFQAISQPIVKDKPHSPKIIMESHSCGPNFVWKAGSWYWNSRKEVFEWKEGKCVKARKSRLWMQGRWASVAGGWKWVPGYWKKL